MLEFMMLACINQQFSNYFPQKISLQEIFCSQTLLPKGSLSLSHVIYIVWQTGEQVTWNQLCSQFG